jgi:hypothetical protein
MSNPSKPDKPSLKAEMAAQITPGPDRIVRREWAGGISVHMATLPQVRLGKRWFSTKQILVASVSTRKTSGESDLGRPVSVVAESRLRVSPRHSPFYCRFQ